MIAPVNLECGVIDEIPAAYNDIDALMDAQRDQVHVAQTLKQVGA